MTLTKKKVKIESSDIRGFWYRRGVLNIDYPKDSRKYKDDDYNSINKAVSFYLNLEKEEVKSTILSHFLRRKSIGNFLNSQTNKVDNLIIANEMGLDIPDTIVTASNNMKNSFFENNQRIITKAMYHCRQNFNQKYSFGTMTKAITKEQISDFNLNGFPSFFQEQIIKEYELRIFYLHGEFYSTAIFSQNDKQTEVDFRNYNKERSTRTPPYKLPDKIRIKLRKFMDRIEQDCGSIDIVVTKDKRYIFIEVNPIGQFFQVSYPSNYYLEKKIARYFYEKEI